jgi:hypothetical protein
MHVDIKRSTSASLTKSYRGAVAYTAKSSIKIEDDEHKSDIKKGEKFYLKTLGNRHYLMDVEGKEIYQFNIEKSVYQQLDKKHTKLEEDKKVAKKVTKRVAANRKRKADAEAFLKRAAPTKALEKFKDLSAEKLKEITDSYEVRSKWAGEDGRPEPGNQALREKVSYAREVLKHVHNDTRSLY